MRPGNSAIGESVVDFVGHRVHRNSIKPRDALVENIDQFPRPKKKKTSLFISRTYWLLSQIFKKFAEIAVPLTNLTKKGES